MLLRQQAGNLRYLRPWQQLLVSVVLVVGGIALIALGVRVGVAAVLVGGRVLWVMGRRRRRLGRPKPEQL
jgi:Flp pilus assembly protein TadB